VDASAAKVARSALKLYRNSAPLLAVLLATFVIAVLAGASITTTRAADSAVAEYLAVRRSESASIRVVQTQLDEEAGIGAATQAQMTSELDQLRADLANAGESTLLPAVDRLSALNRAWNARHSKTVAEYFHNANDSLQLALQARLRTVFGALTAQVRATAFISGLLVALSSIVVVGVAVLTNKARARFEEEVRRKVVLERTAGRFRAMIETIPQIVWIADARGGVTYFNQRWYDYTGQQERDALGEGWIAAVHPDDATKALSAWRDARNSGSFEIEYRLRNKDGNYNWFVGRASPERDADGSISRWLGTCTDVEAQHAQIESLQRLADAFARAQLPETLPSTPLVYFDATYLPAEDAAQVGGDWYDVFPLDGDRFFFSLGDVTGHGMEAAVVMSRVRQAFVSFASIDAQPAVILKRANHVLRMHKESMVTALCGVFDARSGEVTYASAGHPPSLIRRPDGSVRELSGKAPPLGIVDDFRAEPARAHLQAGDILICYTDGIIENERDLPRGEEKLRAVLRKLTPFEFAQPALAIRERILGARRARDDVALLVIARRGIPVDSGTTPAPRAAQAAGKG
jgi:PAS domain S-box-containing protein